MADDGSMPLTVDPAKEITIGATTLSPAPQTVNPNTACDDMTQEQENSDVFISGVFVNNREC